MKTLDLLKKGKLTFKQLSRKTQKNKRTLKKELQSLIKQGKVKLKDGQYHLINKPKKKDDKKEIKINLKKYINKNLLILIIPATLLLMFSGWLNNCYPFQYQYDSYFYKSQFIVNSIKNYGYMPLWSNDWYFGFPLMLYYPPLFNFIVTIISFVINTVLAQNLVIVLSYLLVPVSIFLFLRKNDLPLDVSLIAVILLLSSRIVMINLIWVGNSIFYLSMSLSFLGLAYINDLKNKASLFKYSFFTTLTALTHPAMMIYHVLVSIILGLNYKTLRKCLIGLITGLLMAGTWLVPFALNINHSRNPEAEINVLLHELTTFLIENMVLIIGLVIAIIWLINKKQLSSEEKKILKIALIIGGASLLITTLGSNHFILIRMMIILPLSIGLIISLFLRKYLSSGLIKTSILLILIIMLFNVFSNELLNGNHLLEWMSINGFELILSLSLLSLLFICKGCFTKKSLLLTPLIVLLFSNSIPLAANPNMKCINNVIEFETTGRVFAYPYSQGEYITILPSFMNVKLSGGGLDQVDFRRGMIDNIKSVQSTNYFTKITGADKLLLVMRNPTDYQNMVILNITKYFTLINDSLRVGTRRAALLKVENSTGYTNPRVSYINPNPEKIILFSNFNQTTPLTIKETYFPYWKAYINNKEVNITKTANYFMKVTVPPGEQVIKLKYDIRQQYLLGFIISLIGFGLLCLITFKII